MTAAWDRIRKGAAEYFRKPESFPLRAYSEFMPPPWTALKPYEPERLLPPALPPDGFAVTEFEERRELRPGLERIAGRVLGELHDLAHGRAHGLSQSLLRGNAAWTEPLAAAAPDLARESFLLILPLALSRTQDDKGRVRWTLFGSSHAGPARAFWRSYAGGGPQPFLRLAGWLLEVPAPASPTDLARLGFRIVPRAADPVRPELDEGELPAWARPLRFREGEPVESLRWVLTFEAFARLPEAVRAAFLHGGLRLLPWPGSLVFWEHSGYRAMAAELPWAMQVPLLHLFPHVESRYGIRIPPSGWLDEGAGPEHTHAGGHRLTRHFVRSHRFQRAERDAELAAQPFADKVSVALFSTAADDLDLYGKPMARNAQIWTEPYAPLLHGPSADREKLAQAARTVDQGGRFGYRFLFPPMQAGAGPVFWHRPLVARLDPHTGVVLPDDPPLGFLEAELPGGHRVSLEPRLLDRDGYREAATAFDRDPGHARFTTSADIRRLLEWSELLGGPLDPGFARALLDVGRETSLAEWLASLPGRAGDKAAGDRAAAAVRAVLGPELTAAAPANTFERTATRVFEESLWRTMAVLSEGEWRDKDNADRVLANEGRTGGKLGERVGRRPAAKRDLDALGDWLHARHRELIARHGMEGRAFVADQRFRWETDFDLTWSEGWTGSQGGDGRERNVVVVIPGRDERSVVILADHYDTAYMEDLYEPARGGDRLRAAAAGADDNHSATAALLAAADALLPLAREGRLESTVWLVHLTGEEFPSDCLGARALVRAAVAGRLQLVREDGSEVDASGVRLCGAYVLDMIGHNHDRDRDVFQIAPGEGGGSAQLARLAHEANARWNAGVRGWNKAAERHGKGRAKRMPDGREPPPTAEFLALHGEVRPEWDHRSALYNTDGQIFSDAGIPVVLFMENYDISRTGYHDTDDTMKNIDLDYAAALAAIAIESVAAAASPVARVHAPCNDAAAQGRGGKHDESTLDPVGGARPRGRAPGLR